MKMFALLACCFASACVAGEAGGPNANASIASLNGGAVTGSAVFTQIGTDVLVTISVSGCTAGKSYNTHIHTGPGCADATAQGGHWDMTRGEGIPAIVCDGTTGTTSTKRAATPDTTAWSVGGDMTTNVIGHDVIIHDPDTPTMRIACGGIN